MEEYVRGSECFVSMGNSLKKFTICVWLFLSFSSIAILIGLNLIFSPINFRTFTTLEILFIFYLFGYAVSILCFLKFVFILGKIAVITKDSKLIRSYQSYLISSLLYLFYFGATILFLIPFYYTFFSMVNGQNSELMILQNALPIHILMNQSNSFTYFVLNLLIFFIFLNLAPVILMIIGSNSLSDWILLYADSKEKSYKISNLKRIGYSLKWSAIAMISPIIGFFALIFVLLNFFRFGDFLINEFQTPRTVNQNTINTIKQPKIFEYHDSRYDIQFDDFTSNAILCNYNFF